MKKFLILFMTLISFLGFSKQKQINPFEKMLNIYGNNLVISVTMSSQDGTNINTIIYNPTIQYLDNNLKNINSKIVIIQILSTEKYKPTVSKEEIEKYIKENKYDSVLVVELSEEQFNQMQNLFNK